MTKFFRKIRQKMLTESKFSKYMIYAIGEIFLVVIGILLAIYINERLTENKTNKLRCVYLDELKFTFEYDIKDVEENIAAFEKWNPKLEELLSALENKNLNDMDSVIDKMNAASKYIYFNQRSKSKLEELKYSNTNLIKNRNLKNRILLYQDSEVSALLNAEKRYNLIDQELRQYFSMNLIQNIIQNEIKSEELESNKQFFSIIYQKYNANAGMKTNYKKLLKEQYEISEMIESEINENCKK
jgi:hypothetical protein